MGDVAEKPEAEPLVLTEREIAIARGEDPDAAVEGGKEAELTPEVGQDAAGQPAPEGGKDAAPPAVNAEWVDDDVLGLARSYGLDENDVKQFDDAEAFRKATLLFDKKLLAEAGQKPADVVAAPKAVPVADTVTDDPAAIDPQAYIDAGYDEQTVALVKAHKQLADEVVRLRAEAQAAQQRTAAEFERDRLLTYHDAVDQLDEKRYGRTLDNAGTIVPLTKEADDNRRKLHDTAQLLATKSPPGTPLSVILKRAEKIAFAEELAAEERRVYQEKVAKQSAKRRPAAGRSKPIAAPVSADGDVDEAVDIANRPEIVKAWNRMQEEAGA